jgi:hypothetical protein
MTTQAKLSPAEVATLSDADLSERVAVACFGARVVVRHDTLTSENVCERRDDGCTVWLNGSIYGNHLTPEDAEAVLFVMEHMRERWKDRNWVWSITGYNTEWLVSVSRWMGGCKVIVQATNASHGRAVMEAALLAAQELSDG